MTTLLVAMLVAWLAVCAWSGLMTAEKILKFYADRRDLDDLRKRLEQNENH